MCKGLVRHLWGLECVWGAGRPPAPLPAGKTEALREEETHAQGLRVTTKRTEHPESHVLIHTFPTAGGRPRRTLACTPAPACPLIPLHTHPGACTPLAAVRDHTWRGERLAACITHIPTSGRNQRPRPRPKVGPPAPPPPARSPTKSPVQFRQFTQPLKHYPRETVLVVEGPHQSRTPSGNLRVQ